MRTATILTIGLLTAMAGAQAQGTEKQEPRERAERPKHLVEMNGAEFSPVRITVPAGETVTWKNNDERDHTVRASDKSFDSGTIRSGESFQHQFTRPGTYEYGCAFHPRKKATVVVTERNQDRQKRNEAEGGQ